MYLKEQKFITLFLIISLLILPMTLTANERRGADLVIYKTDGDQVRGELIAVKENSLLLKEKNSGADVTAGIGEIRSIKIVKKSKAVLGATIGGALGALSAYAAYKAPEPAIFEMEAPVILGVAAIGILIGGGVGAIAGTDKTIQIEGKSDAEIKKISEDLRKKARVPDFQ